MSFANLAEAELICAKVLQMGYWEKKISICFEGLLCLLLQMHYGSTLFGRRINLCEDKAFLTLISSGVLKEL